MSESPKKFYLTTPIYYVNARPHIGHAYTTIAADVIARRHRLLGEDTWFLTGTDEHGQKIERSAAAAGIDPQQFTDQVAPQFRGLWDRMGITYDDFIRTTEPRHIAGAQKLFTELYNCGHIYLSTYTGAYCVSDEAFVDLPVGTPCPDCGRILEEVTEENFFFRLSALQLPLLNLIESGELSIQPEVRRNEVLSFLRGNISAAQSSNSVILSGARSAESKDPESPDPANTTQTISNSESTPVQIAHSAAGNPYVPGALKDLSISRSSFKWGIPVPAEVQQKAGATQPHIIYVWLDALINYMSAVGYGSDDPAKQAQFEKYWPADLHLVGKEIIRFHCVYWPAFLMAAELPVPKAITAHGWLLFEESKMSKSRGNIVRTETILDAFGDHYGKEIVKQNELAEPSKIQRDLFASDVLRYFLLREIPFGQDGSFSFDALITRYNADLANGYGNLVSRTLNLIGQYSSHQRVPELPPSILLTAPNTKLQNMEFKGPITGQEIADTKLVQFATIWTVRDSDKLWERSDFTSIINLLSGAIRVVDSYLSEWKPWKLVKSSEPHALEKFHECMYTAAESIRIITALLYPVMPHSTAQVWQQLGLGDIEAAAASGALKDLQWGGLKPGTKLGPLAPIFPRAPKELIAIMANMENPNTHPDSTVALPHITNNSDASARAKTEFRETPISSLSSTPSLNPPAEHLHAISEHHTKPAPATHESAPATAHIAIDDFAKIDLRVAKILVAERIPKADKLLRLEVDLGHEKRQILSGIAEWYTPEELIGRRIVVIANLAPRKMRGLESHGMLLAASHGENGKPILATFSDSEEIELGSRLK